jgi:tRNA(adenine34) deaminase
VTSAASVWNGLPEPWRAAFDEAWASWCRGCFGIGAVAVDDDGAIVARGRNRVLEERREPGVIADSFTAHAEMNVLAGLPWGRTDVELYTTLEPCLMCASAIVMARVPVVHFAGDDPLFAGLTEVLDAHPFASERLPARNGPMADGLGRFARLLPLSFVAFWTGAEGPAVAATRSVDPDLAALALRMAEDTRLTEVRDACGTTLEALEQLWPDIA